MAKNEIQVTLKLVQEGGNIKLAEQQVKKLGKQTDNLDRKRKKLTKTTDKYNRREKGVARLGMNSTKSFSKMQQGIGGEGGGTGGLVRAYALLAANVFALSAAFGILSRAAQIDTLAESMKVLEVTSGKAILGVARDLQEASGFGMDFAEAMRATSLAMSAGFGGGQIQELAAVAKNAAVSLGRNVPDALDRIFRGVIKVEPELLDEIGLFVRVNEASAKYAAQIGVAAAELTEFEKRQAFLNEALEQGNTKFKAFEDVQIDPFAELATVFSDMTQGILSFFNRGLLPVVSMLAKSKALFGAVFGLVAFTLIKLAIPAMTTFTKSLAANANKTLQNANAEKSRATAMANMANQQHVDFLRREKEKVAALAQTAMAKTQGAAPVEIGVRGKTKSRALEKALQKEVSLAGRKQIITQRIMDLEKKTGFEKRMQSKEAVAELANLKAELAIHDQIAIKEAEIAVSRTTQGIAGPKSVATLSALKAQRSAISANALAIVAATASTHGFQEAMRVARLQLVAMNEAAIAAGISLGFLTKAMFIAKAGAVSLGIAAQTMWMRILGPFSIFLMLIPAFQAFHKWMGGGSEAAEELTKANKNSADALDVLGARLEYVKEQMADPEMSIVERNKAMDTFKNTILTTANALEEQSKAFEKYMNEASPWATWWGETLPAAFGGGTANALAEGRTAFIDELRKTPTKVTPALATAMAALDVASATKVVGKGMQKRNVLADPEGFAKAQKEVVKVAREEALAFANIRSAIDGAKDSARAYTNSLIVKTDVDKPLSSFKQITANLASQAITEEERLNFAKEITADAAVRAMLTQEERNNLDKAVKAGKGYEEVLEKVENRYFKQQESLIRIKSELKAITNFQRQLAAASKLSADVAKALIQNEVKVNKLKKEQAEYAFTNRLTATGLEEAKIRELANEDDLITKLQEKGLKQEQIQNIQAAINSYRERENLLIEQAIQLATRAERIEMTGAQALLKDLKGQAKLNKLTEKYNQMLRRQATYDKTGRRKQSGMEKSADIIAAEKVRLKTAKEIMDMEIIVVEAQAEIEAIKMETLAHTTKMTTEQYWLLLDGANAIRASGEDAANAIRKAAQITAQSVKEAVEDLLPSGSDFFEKSFGTGTRWDEMALAIQEMNKLGDTADDNAKRWNIAINFMESDLLRFSKEIADTLGEDGIFLSALAQVSANLMDMVQNFSGMFGEDGFFSALQDNFGETMAKVLSGTAAMVGQVRQLIAAESRQAVVHIDRMIEAEEKRDGKSKASLAKMAALEKKKEAIKRKAFEQNKKLLIAETVMNTAAGMMMAFATSKNWIVGLILAAMVATMGMAQLSVIKGMTYQGGGGQAPSAPQEIKVGKRSNRIDVSKGGGSGELAYLRGQKGIGTSAQNFSPTGGAAGMIKNYATGGIIVGEQGPEMITPTGGGYEITPNEALRAGGTTNANFTINAVDAAGVEDVLTNQRGNIISMIREAAHDHGEEFIEAVDTNAYGDASTSNTWTGKGGG